MSISKKNQTFIFLIVAILWFIAGGLFISTNLPIGMSLLTLGFVFVALTATNYKKIKNNSA